jgi:hypothetical protein
MTLFLCGAIFVNLPFSELRNFFHFHFPKAIDLDNRFLLLFFLEFDSIGHLSPYIFQFVDLHFSMHLQEVIYLVQFTLFLFIFDQLCIIAKVLYCLVHQ